MEKTGPKVGLTWNPRCPGLTLRSYPGVGGGGGGVSAVPASETCAPPPPPTPSALRERGLH